MNQNCKDRSEEITYIRRLLGRRSGRSIRRVYLTEAMELSAGEQYCGIAFAEKDTCNAAFRFGQNKPP